MPGGTVERIFDRKGAVSTVEVDALDGPRGEFVAFIGG